MSNRTLNLPPDISVLLDDTPPVTDGMRDRLRRAAESAEDDPLFHAELMKSSFLEEMRHALVEREESQSQLARRWGRSRQYLSKVFAEDKRVNFTIETLCELAHLVGRRVQLLVLREDEESHVLRFAKPRAVHRIHEFSDPIANRPRIYAAQEEFAVSDSSNALDAHSYDAA